MLNCDWASALTRYNCVSVRGKDGQSGLEIGTPFSLPDGTAINLYLMPSGSHVLISDNADTLIHLSGMGLDVWNAARFRALRERLFKHSLSLEQSGEIRALTTVREASLGFARAITGMLSICEWASDQMRVQHRERDLISEAEPYIIARNPRADFTRSPRVLGASRTEHYFDFQHGSDLIDVIAPSAQSTGGVMRKIGDVTNGPFAERLSPLVIVDDRFEPLRAEGEMGILASITRTQPFTSLARSVH